MAQNSTEIELEPLVFSEDDLQNIEEPVEPVKEFTLVPEGDSSSAVVDGYTDAETYELEIKAAEKRAAISKPVGISKVSLTSEIIDDFRLNFGSKASEALAKDLTKTFEQDYAEQISENPDFFSYELLQSGKAAFFDQLPPSYTMEVNGKETPIRDMLPAERAARFNNPDAISALLSNADIGSLPRRLESLLQA